MEIRAAQAFIAVAEELNFGRAAQRLHMASPPLSRLIRRIEVDLGAPLFERNTRSVTLTPQGEALLEPARELVRLSQRMKEIVQKSQAGEAGRVRFGFGEAAVNSWVGEVARRIRSERPGISLELHSGLFSQQGLDKIIDGSLDLLIGRRDFIPAEVDSVVIAREQLLIAMPEGHPLAGSEAVDLRDLAKEPWVVLPGGGAGASLPNRLNLLAVNGGFVPNIVEIAPDSPTLLLLVGARVGIAPTLSSVRDNVRASGVVFRSVHPDQGPVEVRLMWRRGDRNPALNNVIRVATEVFATP
ncbi:LysR family transcriptional regulator [Rhodococcus sp. NPDC003318]|uniref:LysR family transcriptional regulator n=1 Tax=Rhodococcus sp. NPDC003318 TaxID=3364503 RepID=UPI00368DF31E